MTIEQILEAISKYGISTVFAVILLVVFLKYFLWILTIIVTKLDQIIWFMTKRELFDFQTTWVFKAVLSEHIHKKLMIVKQKLIENDIVNRRKQLEISLSQSFFKITQEEVAFLSTFITPAWDIWEILWAVLEPKQWKIFMWSVFEIFFWPGDQHTKMQDLSDMMNKIVNDMVAVIEDKIKKNTNP